MHFARVRHIEMDQKSQFSLRGRNCNRKSHQSKAILERDAKEKLLLSTQIALAKRSKRAIINASQRASKRRSIAQALLIAEWLCAAAAWAWLSSCCGAGPSSEISEPPTSISARVSVRPRN